MILLKQVEVYSPEYIGRKDILTGGGVILAIEPEIRADILPGIQVVEAEGLIAIPGLIDNHVHIAGAGGEGGPSTRTPEMKLSSMFEGGVTTVIGCLGTDGFTRNVESVLMKAKAIRADGGSAWIWTGAYQVPVRSLTGDIGKDIALIEEVIGVGELALSDHRSSYPTTEELIRIASHARVGGMLVGKAGIVNIHLGDARDPFRPIHDAVSRSELKYTQFLPTHCNRNDYIFEDAKAYGKKGYVDITTSSWPYFREEEIKPSTALKMLLEAGVAAGNITFSSDSCGSLPGFDEKGDLVRLEMGMPSANLREIREAVTDEKIPLEIAVQSSTSSPATILKLRGKGFIRRGYDADIVILDRGLNIVHLLARGRHAVRDGDVIMKGSYE